jgi:hypothetical protein
LAWRVLCSREGAPDEFFTEALPVNNLSEITTAVIALLVVIGTIALIVLGKPVPPELWSWGGIVLGFFYGNAQGVARGLLARK